MSLRNGRTRLSASEISKIRPKRLRKRKFFPRISPELLRELCAEKEPKAFSLPNGVIEFAESNRQKLQPSPYCFSNKQAVSVNTNDSTVTTTTLLRNEQTSKTNGNETNLRRRRSKIFKPGHSASLLFQSPHTPKKSILPKKSNSHGADGLQISGNVDHHQSSTPNDFQDLHHSVHGSKNDLEVLSYDVPASDIGRNSPPVGITVALHLSLIAVITDDDLFTVFDCIEGTWKRRELGKAGGYRQLYWFMAPPQHHEQIRYLLMVKPTGIRICSIVIHERSKMPSNIVIKLRTCSLTLVGGSEICNISDDHNVVKYAWSGGEVLDKVLTFNPTTEKLLSLSSINGYAQALIGCSYDKIYIWNIDDGRLLQRIDVGFTLYTDLLCCVSYGGIALVHRVNRQMVTTAECCELLALNPANATSWVVESHEYVQDYRELLDVNICDATKNDFGRIHDKATVRKLFADIRFKELDNSDLKLAGCCAELKYKSKRRRL